MIDITYIILIILLSVAIVFLYISINTQCSDIIQQDHQIVYRFKPDLDLQFDDSNFPTTIYSKMFSGPNTFQGGYDISSGRSVKNTSVNNQNNKGGTL